MEQAKPEDRLPFSPAKQEALIGHLITNERFFIQARARILPDWFGDPRLNQIWKISTEWYSKYGKVPKPSEIKESREVTKMAPADQRVIDTRIEQSMLRMADFSLESIADELTDFLQARIYHKEVMRSQSSFNSGKFQDAYLVLRNMAREIESVSFQQGEAILFEDPAADFNDNQMDMRKALTFGLQTFDRLLLGLAHEQKEVTGSLLPGDTTIILAPTNVGKTTAMISMAMHNIAAGKDILFITHEGRPQDIKRKFWCAASGMSRHQVDHALTTPEGQQYFWAIRDGLKEHLVYIPLNKAGLTVEEVEAVIRREQEKWKATHNGKGFDMVVNDYLAKLTTQQAKGGRFQRRDIDEVVYNYGVQLALEYNFHFLTAIQANREGSKINKGFKGYEHRLLSMEDVLESWGPMTSATNVISINRSPEDIVKDRVVFYICKSRSSETGIAVVCRSKYAAAVTHAEELGCTYYRGSHTMTDRLEELLVQYRDKEALG